MNTRGDDGSRSARLPRVLQRPAALVQTIVRTTGRRQSPRYVYESDGMATAWYSPFLDNGEWQAHYDEMARDWFTGGVVDVRWRMWILTELARSADGSGAFAEFGTNRGGCAYMMLVATRKSPLYMFDTFAGIPDTNLTEQGAGASRGFRAQLVGRIGAARQGAPGAVAGTDTLLCRRRLRDAGLRRDRGARARSPGSQRRRGDAARARVRPSTPAHRRRRRVRRLRGTGYEDQRAVIDSFFAGTRDRPVALPTGQALVVKSP